MINIQYGRMERVEYKGHVFGNNWFNQYAN